MHALRLNKFGELSGLRVEEIATPSAGQDELLIRVSAASVNPSDVKNVQGFMHQTTLPRIPGRDFAGTVVAGRSDMVGHEVWGTGGDLGFTRDGSHAEYLLIPAAAAVARPERLKVESAACCGVTFVVAAYGLRDANLAAGQTVAVIGVFGGVGRAVAQIAKRAGARVIGIALSDPPKDLPPGMQDAEYIKFSRDDVKAKIDRLTGGRGVDIVYDAVGGAMLLEALKLLANRGRVLEIAAGRDPNVMINIRDFYHKEARLIGIDSLSLDAVQSAAIFRDLAAGFESGELMPPPVAATYSLEQAEKAYQAVAAGKGEGRHVIKPNG